MKYGNLLSAPWEKVGETYAKPIDELQAAMDQLSPFTNEDDRRVYLMLRLQQEYFQTNSQNALKLKNRLPQQVMDAFK